MMVTDFFTPSLSPVVATLNLLILGAVTYPCTGIGNYQCGTDIEDIDEWQKSDDNNL